MDFFQHKTSEKFSSINYLSFVFFSEITTKDIKEKNSKPFEKIQHSLFHYQLGK